MKRLTRTSILLTSALALLATFFSARSVSATTYYVATSGSDTNNGTSKTTPWAHLPGMANATGTAGSHSAVAGDTFVLRGCDVWYNASLPLVLNHGGSSGNPVTITVDQTWYNTTSCPSAWNRPVFDAHTSSQLQHRDSNWRDNLRLRQRQWKLLRCHSTLRTSRSIGWRCAICTTRTMLKTPATGKMAGSHISNADYVTVSNGYEHAWTMGPYSANSVNDADEFVSINGNPSCPHCLMTYNVANNCATTQEAERSRAERCHLRM